MSSAPRRARPAGLSLSQRSFATARSVEIGYTLDTDADSVFVGIWNHFAFHVRTLVAGEAQSAGRHSVVWEAQTSTAIGSPAAPSSAECR